MLCKNIMSCQTCGIIPMAIGSTNIIGGNVKGRPPKYHDQVERHYAKLKTKQEWYKAHKDEQKDYNKKYYEDNRKITKGGKSKSKSKCKSKCKSKSKKRAKGKCKCKK